jgi:hypothetical protein
VTGLTRHAFSTTFTYNDVTEEPTLAGDLGSEVYLQDDGPGSRKIERQSTWCPAIILPASPGQVAYGRTTVECHRERKQEI